MTKKKSQRAGLLDGVEIGTHVCVPRAKLVLILEACDAAASGGPEAPILALDTIRAIVTPYLEAE